MNILEHLLNDHKKFHQLGRDLESLSRAKLNGDTLAVQKLVAEFKQVLLDHAWFEDTFFFPALLPYVDQPTSRVFTKTFLEHLSHEHQAIDNYVVQLEKEVTTVPLPFSWPQTFALFSLALRGHLRREEEDVFPEAERLLGEAELNRLAYSWEQHLAAKEK